MTVLEFSRMHWAAASALFIATSLAVATGTIIFLHPGIILAVAGFTLSDAMPLAFIGLMPLPAAITTLSALVFSINLILSTFFNIVVAIYNAMDHFFRPDDINLGDGYRTEKNRDLRKLLSEHWAMTFALLIATAFAIAIATVAFLYPPFILAIAGFTLFDTTPLAFIGPMPLPAAVLTITALVFSINVVASILFNTVVTIYNGLDHLLQPELSEHLITTSHRNMQEGGLKKRQSDGDKMAPANGGEKYGDDTHYFSPIDSPSRGIKVDGHLSPSTDIGSPRKNNCF
ncbi:MULTISPECIES: hypothetical protein [unclassified Legionella]|uniref:hypothetical protein n=1 Tax=unclassified Legionella TaxID=2622702 RepID=UPI001E552006|nr:hypothetical protein [Legionella sp. 31fI33]MCC5014549.1 hypothetical protein [Legionella sp. 31fI33]